jgi:hypothetical protein
MKNVITLKTLALGFVLAAVSFGANAAQACDTYPQPSYRKVIVQVPKTIAVDRYVTRYDHCGYPYKAVVTTEKTIWVSVEKVVRVY